MQQTSLILGKNSRLQQFQALIIKQFGSEGFWKERISGLIAFCMYAGGNLIEFFSGKLTDDPPALWMTGITLSLLLVGTSMSRYRQYSAIFFKLLLYLVNFNAIYSYAESTKGPVDVQSFYLFLCYAVFIVTTQLMDSRKEVVSGTIFEIVLFAFAVYVNRQFKPILLQQIQQLMFVFVLVGNYVIAVQRMRLTQISGNSTIQFKAISENARDIQCIINTDFNFLYINPSIKDTTGYEVNELTGRKFLTLVAEPDQHQVTDALAKIKQTPEEKQSVEYRIKSTNGGLIWVESIFSSFKISQTGKADLIFAETRNIETRKKLEEEIQQQLRMEEMLIKHSNQFINVGRAEIQNGIDIALGEFGTMLGANAVLVYRMSGKLQDEFRSTNQWITDSGASTIPHFNLSIKINQQLVAFLRTMRGERASHGDFFTAQQLVDIHALNTPEIEGKRFYLIPLQSGNIANGFVVFVFSEDTYYGASSFFGLIGNMVSSAFTRMRTEMRLHEAQLTNESILRALPDWLYIVNKDGEFTGTNNHSTLPDYIPDYGLIGRTFNDVLPGEIATNFGKALSDVIETDIASSFEYNDTTIYKGRRQT
jgi:PAS domain S-box-containing protein